MTERTNEKATQGLRGRARAQDAFEIQVYDSETDGRARWGGHSSFDDPTTRPDAPPRESIEVLRGINGYLKSHSLPEIPERTIENMLHENWKKVFKSL